MKTDKEYPATHSMSTAWYIVDEDGNVGIMDFNENGPVPWETEETSVRDLVFGHEEDYKKKEYLPIDLTNEQIDELLGPSHSPEEENLWFDCVVQIDKNQESEFLCLSERPDFEICECISKERGLYEIDAFDCIEILPEDQPNKIKQAFTLWEMLEKGLIKEVYRKSDFDTDDDYNGEEYVHEKRFDSAPYYIFHQPYSNWFLPKCVNVPKHPVKLDQIPEKLRWRVLQVPLKFSKDTSFQIAEWYPCDAMYYTYEIQYLDGNAYGQLPMSDGSMAYFIRDLLAPSFFFKYCSEKNKYGCKDCESDCYTMHNHCFTVRPTVLMISHPLHRLDYTQKTKSDLICWHSIRIPFLPKIPLKIPVGPSECSSSPYESFVSDDTISKHVTQEMIMNYLQVHRKWFEDAVARFNPRVIILCEEVESFLGKLYKITANQITINGVDYPMYRKAEIEEHRKEIERLALLPYQGKEIPHIISVEEMEKIKQQQ